MTTDTGADRGAELTRRRGTGHGVVPLIDSTVVAYPRGGGRVRGTVVDEGYSPTHGQQQCTVQPEGGRRLVCVLADEIEEIHGPTEGG
jgi:hypothetical protein